ncbi:hypothetical protein LPJ61_007045 [Coemansia biformis]|uniref:AAA-ATPase-like domain-containing protein n=1 Tax=Coemansia biformis TaxID=1286918 RepID=A0A9W7XRX5_9FUNG|nr:hypothetical protein LPJ61_007045 [Coemansia biformis]
MLFDALSSFVAAQHGKYIVLVDEYDQPLKATLNKDWRIVAQGTYLELIGRIFKSNDNLERGLLVGVHAFQLASVNSGVNNIRNIPLTTRGYCRNAASSEGRVDSMTGIGLFTELFAFSRVEIEELVRKALAKHPLTRRDLENVTVLAESPLARRDPESVIVDILTAWYDGYDFGLVGRRYNPVSVLRFLGNLAGEGLESAARSYWVDTGNERHMVKLATTYRADMLLLAPRLIRDYDTAGTNCSVQVVERFSETDVDVLEVVLGSSSFPDDNGHLHGSSNLVTYLIHLGYDDRS